MSARRIALAAVLICALVHSADAAPTLGQYAGGPRLPNGRLNVTGVVAWMAATYTNTYNVLLWDTTGDAYLDLVALLHSGSPLSVWVTLIPPTEVTSGRCSIPADSPLTPWNDTAFFNASKGPHGCMDYVGWGRALARLRGMFPALYAANIDDFGTITNQYYNFPEAYIREIRAALNAGGVRFVPTVYYRPDRLAPFVLDRFPWLVNGTDGFLFYFRNDKQGPKACAVNCSATPPSTCYETCLWGVCAERSVPNLAGEVGDFTAALRNTSQQVFLGVYFSEYSSCPPGPSVRYDYEVLHDAVVGPLRSQLAGAMVYTVVYPPQQPCVQHDGVPATKACVVQQVFRDAAGLV